MKIDTYLLCRVWQNHPSPRPELAPNTGQMPNGSWMPYPCDQPSKRSFNSAFISCSLLCEITSFLSFLFNTTYRMLALGQLCHLKERHLNPKQDLLIRAVLENWWKGDNILTVDSHTYDGPLYFSDSINFFEMCTEWHFIRFWISSFFPNRANGPIFLCK